ncbi:nicotinate-nucleotide adenylyltransferase [Roseospira marina]|uniref:Probable nicotinate-nucleotide adenylyltransferase n=1 Tax=Roseospira marina TaxID=140057 RepID=A0A5M6IDL4_9PROT|nr:nicotinate-nucleotide adenylyltransferase [Roseospira marina]KAA5606162.1 nicotinate-nucleotide adenylyltransferase [Roseospira marina]MBB4314302.1 nicotinate-nucleotide adenylyltransferase [Roseospira marina]MBB5087462.1 nicotinate-nucleotide adenylyltransferase [Roseospira marina]
MSCLLSPPPFGDRRRVRIGLLGGSFNPAHAGHRHIGLEALRRLDLDQVWWLVSPGNPLKAGHPMAPLAERMAQANRMARHPRMVPTGIEDRLGTRYTIDTVRALTRRFPRVQFVWLMGADNLAQFHRWRGWTALMEIVPVAVFDRPQYSCVTLWSRTARRYAPCRRPTRSAATLAGTGAPAWVFLPIRRHAASATAIRAGQAGSV